MLWSQMRSLRGKHRISVKQYRAKRTDRQNRFYWPCFVVPFGRFLREQGEAITDDDAHEMLKLKFLRIVVQDARAGDLECTRSTTTLTKEEFNEYLDRCGMFLSQMFGIQIPEPSIYWEKVDT